LPVKAGEGRPWRGLSGGGKRFREASGFPQVSLGLGMVAGYIKPVAWAVRDWRSLARVASLAVSRVTTACS
jgi:hypothetical protein